MSDFVANALAVLFVVGLVVVTVMGFIVAWQRETEYQEDVRLDKAIRRERLLLMREKRLRLQQQRLAAREQRIRELERDLGMDPTPEG